MRLHLLRILLMGTIKLFLLKTIISENVTDESKENQIMDKIMEEMTSPDKFVDHFVKAFGDSHSEKHKMEHKDENEKRLKRSIDVQAIGDSLLDEEYMLAVPLKHEHLHRDKRAPCHTGTGGGTGGDNTATNDDYIDDAERRRRANARRRQAAARKRAKANKQNTTNNKKKFTNDDNNMNQALERRKRQSEADDLNEDTPNKLSQHIQEFGEKLSHMWSNFTQAMNDMAEKVKQHFSEQNSTTSMET